MAEPALSEIFAAHVAGARWEDLPADAVAQAKIFILDSFGVGIAGATAAGATEVMQAARLWGQGLAGQGAAATVWGRREMLPAVSAALLNGFQMHCQEYDCLSEAAVLHPMAAVLSAAMAYAEHAGGVSGRDLILAVALGVDIACYLGIAGTEALRFFRPAVAGGFGAVAAVARLAGFDADRIVHAFGLQLAQTSGTMQAHVEASPVLPLQVGFNARAGLQSCDLAATGLQAPRLSLDGPFGYLPLFEGPYDLAPVHAGLGRRWLIAELSHKPYPAGRATHGAVEAMRTLQAAHKFTADEVEEIVISGPPVLSRLTGRPDIASPSPAYARLCIGYVVAKTLLHGRIGVEHYRGAEQLTDPATHRLAARVRTVVVGDNPHALAPQAVTVQLSCGAVLNWECDSMLASPSRRLSRAMHIEKFEYCWQFAETPLGHGSRDTLIAAVDNLEQVGDVRTLAALLRPADLEAWKARA